MNQSVPLGTVPVGTHPLLLPLRSLENPMIVSNSPPDPVSPPDPSPPPEVGGTNENGGGAVGATAPPECDSKQDTSLEGPNAQGVGEVQSCDLDHDAAELERLLWDRSFSFDSSSGTWYFCDDDFAADVLRIEGAMVRVFEPRFLPGLSGAKCLPVRLAVELIGGGQVRCRRPADFGPLSCRTFADIQPASITWLAKPLLPLGKLSLLQGHPGLGKSTISLDIAARLSSGQPMPGSQSDPVAVGDTLVIAGEDGAADTMRPRLDAAGADVSRIHIVDGIDRGGTSGPDPFSLDKHVELLGEAIRRQPDIRFVVIDPVTQVLGLKDANCNQDVRAVLRPLMTLAEETGIAVLLINHLRKGDGERIEKGLGSMGFPAVSRTVMELVRHPDDPQRRLLRVVKSNIGHDQIAIGIGFEDVGGVARLVWDSEFHEHDADATPVSPRPSKERIAEQFLINALKDGPVAKKEILSAAQLAGVSERTLQRAKAGLPVTCTKLPTHWEWRLGDRAAG